MNELLKNQVQLYKVILKNAESQFASFNGNMLKSAKLPDDNLKACVDTELVSGQTRYRIETSTTGSTWTMKLIFDLDSAIEEMPYVVLSFTQLNNKIQEMEFQNVTKNGVPNQYTAILNLDELSERDSLLRALSEYESKTTLVVCIKGDNGLLNVITDPQIFYFATDFYPYIYKGLEPPVNVQGFILKEYEFNNYWYSYYQDNITRSNLFYLPDSFELGVDYDNNNKPMLSIYFSIPPGAEDTDDATATLQYFLLPKVKKERIMDATSKFRNEEARGKLIPLSNAKEKKLMMKVNNNPEVQTDALINLQSGISGSFTIPLSKFSSIWDSFFNTAPTNTFLRGQVSVKLEGFNPNEIPVELRMPVSFKDKLDAFIDPSKPASLKKEITFTSDESSYDTSGPKPIKRILVDCGGTTAILDKDHLSQKVIVKIPLSKIIMEGEQYIIYHYNLQIRYVDGTSRTLNNQQSTFEVIYVP